MVAGFSSCEPAPFPAGASPQQCPGGAYSNQPRLASCLPCPARYYCDATNLSAGGYVVPQQCPAGSYCPPGTAQATQFLCPAGTFAPDPGLADATECLGCLAGSYCSTPGLSAPTGPCQAGFFCSNGSSVANPVNQTYGDQCPAGYYCPAGASAPSACPAGTFSAQLRVGALAGCQPCSAGYYCPDGAQTSPHRLCWGGWYCPGGQAVPNPPAYNCPVGFYCPEGAAVPLRCPSGTYQDAPSQYKCSVCPSQATATSVSAQRKRTSSNEVRNHFLE